MAHIIETERLFLREFEEKDSTFILELVNSEEWLKNIGDKNIKTDQQAKDYLIKGPIKSYHDNGFGLSMVELKKGNIPIGMCGLIKRDTLENPDIGFAFLPQYIKQGFGYEIASKTLKYAGDELQMQKVAAITIPENTGSIRLLEKIGMHFEKSIKLQEDSPEVMLFSN